jgi:hypothetical protein
MRQASDHLLVGACLLDTIESTGKPVRLQHMRKHSAKRSQSCYKEVELLHVLLVHKYKSEMKIAC